MCYKQWVLLQNEKLCLPKLDLYKVYAPYSEMSLAEPFAFLFNVCLSSTCGIVVLDLGI